MRKIERIYISGPITGTPDAQTRFGDAEERLHEAGYTKIINPQQVAKEADTDGSMRHEEYMHLSFALIDLCDAVYMMRDWQQSKGACMECGYALAKRKRIIHEIKEAHEDISRSPGRQQPSGGTLPGWMQTGTDVLIRGQIIGRTATGEKRVRIQTSDSDDLYFFADDSSLEEDIRCQSCEHHRKKGRHEEFCGVSGLTVDDSEKDNCKTVLGAICKAKERL
jgi:hypothetical protein